MNNKNFQKIQSVILEKKLLFDRFGKDYLLLRLEEEQVIFVFSSKVRVTEWEQLREGGSYIFTIEESENKNKVLVSFEKLISYSHYNK